MVANWILFLITTFILWYIGYPGLYAIHNWLPMLVGVVFIAFHLAVMLGFGLILATIVGKREILFSQRLRKLVLKIYLPLTISAPLTIMARRLFNISKEDVQRSFIEVNNYLIQVKRFGLTPEQLLLLLPQCLQRSDCTIRIARDILACKQCGGCQMKEIIHLCKRYGVKACVATGGTLARKIIVEQKPQAVIAVACERELVDGIQDCYPLPVFGILNQRPHGPCMDTGAALERVESAITHFLAVEEPAEFRLAGVEEQKEQVV
jgi:hypothetical protein